MNLLPKVIAVFVKEANYGYNKGVTIINRSLKFAVVLRANP